MKLALIGGGSVRTIYFARSFAAYAQSLGFDELYIMDMDREKLRIFGSLARYEAEKKADALGVRLEIVLTTSLDEAVRGADYVVTTIRSGGDEARVLDERIALKHGLIGQETTGAGGFVYALRSIPDLIGIMDRVKALSNNATVFNFTNPSGLVTQALYDAGFDNIVGICDNATETKISLGRTLRLNASEFNVRTYGLNHLTWSDQVVINGRDILPKLFEHDEFIENFHEFRYFDSDLVKRLRSIPNGYLYYYYHRERALANMLASPRTRGESIKEINDQMLDSLRHVDVEASPEEALDIYKYYMQKREGSYMQMELGGSGKEMKPIDIRQFGIEELKGDNDDIELLEGYAGVAFNYIQARKNDRRVEIAVNVQNKGAVQGMDDDDVVEISCIVDKDGLHRAKVDKVPGSSLLLMKTIKRYEKLTIEACMHKSRDLAIEALMIHPLVNSYSIARDLFDDYQRAHSRYLGDYR
ncbi:MAG TPA: glycoside hydrolase [Candidatus Atribacteria bacterium]|nr:glycoside hydrolase [Candidatus Atribacteria bacterium]